MSLRGRGVCARSNLQLSQFVLIAFLCTSFQDRLGLGQVRQSVLAEGDFIFDHQTLWQFDLVGLLAERQQLFHFPVELDLQFEQALVAHRFALGSVGMNLGPNLPFLIEEIERQVL